MPFRLSLFVRRGAAVSALLLLLQLGTLAAEEAPTDAAFAERTARRLLGRAARVLGVEDFVVVEEARPCLHVRAMPSAEGAVLECLQAGAPLEVVGLTEEWLRVRIESGREGWVERKLVRSLLRQQLDAALYERDRARRELAQAEARAARLAEELTNVRLAATAGRKAIPMEPLAPAVAVRDDGGAAGDASDAGPAGAAGAADAADAAGTAGDTSAAGAAGDRRDREAPEPPEPSASRPHLRMVQMVQMVGIGRRAPTRPPP